MISFEQALEIVQQNVLPVGKVKVPMIQALNRVLAEDIVSDMDMPPFNKAAMDGYACRKQDISGTLEIIEEIPAGAIPSKKIGEGQCSRIMTGAMVPEGADFILMKEHTDRCDKNKIRSTKVSSNENICYRGEDVKEGDIVLKKGTIVLPQHIAILASVGCVNPFVFQLPSVAVISTGNELVEPSQKPGASQIRNSNGYQIIAQLMRLGISPDYIGIIRDNEMKLKNILAGTISKYNVIILSGGVSVGDYDFVPIVLNKLGVEIKFHGLTAKPGKHMLFGTFNDRYVFGLPGNPVSSFVQFEILIKPLLQKLMGAELKNSLLNIPVGNSYSRKKDDVLSFVPVVLNNKGFAIPLEYHGSAHINSYADADGIMEVPIGIKEFKHGEIVRVRPL
jgi:molybdopterin molybdotransferase